MTRPAFDVISTFGCLDALELPGSVIVALLVDRGYTASNVRNQIARLMHRDLLCRRREGPHAIYWLSERLAGQFRRAGGRVPTPPFTGTFSQLLYLVPEEQRGFKDRLLYLAESRGYGRLRSGVLIAPADRSESVRGLLGPVPAGAWLQSCRLVTDDRDQARELIDRAFRLSESDAALTQLEDRFLQREAQARAGRRLDAQGHFDLHYDAAGTVFRIPSVPAEFLVRELPGRASALMQALSQHYARWIRPHDLALVSDLPAAGLIRRRS